MSRDICDVERCIRNLKRHKAAGHDNVTSEHLLFAYSAPPDPLAGFGGPTSKERKREGREGEKGKGGEGGGEETEGEGKERAMSPPHYLEEVYAYVTL